MEWWSEFGPAVLTIAGALLGGAIASWVSWLTSRAGLKNTWSMELSRLRRDEYLEAIRLVEQMRRGLDELASSVSGRTEPPWYAGLAQRRQAKESDAACVRALDRFFEALLALRLQSERIRAVANDEITARLEEVTVLTNGYLRNSLLEERMFRAEAFDEMKDEFDVLSRALTAAIRDDLDALRIRPARRHVRPFGV